MPYQSFIVHDYEQKLNHDKPKGKHTGKEFQSH